ncbi:dihydroneopterin aldolase, partial [Latilactobacillus sakei subsp. carnosus]|uniref:dihydroneopterin aldolase n=1 Tax=Latilactobacillus sakei TaxID=1599 RepID=UPI003629B64C
MIRNLDMPNDVAQIQIKDLRLRTYIGFNDDEKANKQDVVINALIEYPAEQACLTDEVL